MATINIPQNKFLSQLLLQIATGLTLLNKNDPSVQQVAQFLQTSIISSSVQPEPLLENLSKAKEIVDSYGLEPKGQTPSNDPIIDLPLLIINAINEIDHITTQQEILDKTSLDRQIENVWIKLANYWKLK